MKRRLFLRNIILSLPFTLIPIHLFAKEKEKEKDCECFLSRSVHLSFSHAYGMLYTCPRCHRVYDQQGYVQQRKKYQQSLFF